MIGTQDIWLSDLRVDPRPTLLASNNEALRHFARRDLLNEGVGSDEQLWTLPEAAKILRRQQGNGSWRHRGKTKYEYPTINSDLPETLRNLGRLLEFFAFTRAHPAVEAAIEYLLSCQTEDGDFRGILGTQYTPYYQGLALELIIRAGYVNDRRVTKGIEWLISIVQDDGGWMLPIQTVPSNDRRIFEASPIPFDKTLPSSHFATGMVLRAFAVHPRWRRSRVACNAARYLKLRFFMKDTYTARQAPSYWTKFQYPFWWPNLLTALDSLSRMGFTREDSDIARGLEWFIANQQPDGLWRSPFESKRSLAPKPRERESMEWVSLAVCRVFRRFWDQDGRSESWGQESA